MILAMVMAAAMAQSGEDLRPKELAELDELRAEVRLLGLFSAMQLTKEQSKGLLECAKRARERADALVKENSDLIAEAKKALEAMKAALEKGETVTEEMKTEITRTERESQKRLQEAQADIAPIAKKAMELLDEKQLGILQRFDPTGRRKDPLAQEKEKTRQGLLKVRDASQDDVLIGVDRVVSQFETKTGKLTDEEREAECERLLKIIEKAQGMSEEELAKKVDGLVEEIFTQGRIGEAVAKAGGAAAGGGQPVRAVAEVLFTPRAIRLLEKKAE